MTVSACIVDEMDSSTNIGDVVATTRSSSTDNSNGSNCCEMFVLLEATAAQSGEDVEGG